MLKMKIQTCRGGLGACSPGKILETLKCLGLHFAHFRGGEREKDNVEKLDEKANRQRLIFQKYNTWLKITAGYSLSTRRANRLAGSLACEGRVTLLPGKTFCHVYNLARPNEDSQSICECCN